MALPDSFLDELVARNDIVDVVSDYVSLTKRSGNNLFGLCPFHSEKTPSFSVSSEKQIYHCFGCGKGGGVINFIMEIENLPFMDAVSFLAKRAGMQVPDNDTPETVRNRRARLLELNRDAAKFFYSNFKKPWGQPAIEYLNKRQISFEMVKRFGLGVAPNEWNSLTDEMLKKGYTQSELVDGGLSKRGRNGGLYDTFRNRLIFPVIDVRGSVIGFSGRILDDGEPKYLNSPDTPVFQKSRNLFGLNLAKRTKRGMLILVEGNVDVVSLHQAGFDCAVASLGTALTPEQARLMSRYTQNVVICYDNDGAGQKAAQRAIGIFEKTGITVKVLRISDAKDPDEYIKKFGGERFSLLLEKSENHVEYRLLSLKSKYNLENDDERIEFLHEATEMLATLPSAIERDIYGAKVAEYAGVSKEAVALEVRRNIRKSIATQKKKQEKRDMSPHLTVQPADKSIRYENVQSAVAEEGVIRILMRDPEFVNQVSLSEEDFTSPFLGKVYGIIRQRFLEGDSVSSAVVTAQLKPEEASQLTLILQRPISTSNVERELSDYINRINDEKLKASSGGDLLAARERLLRKKGLGD